MEEDGVLEIGQLDREQMSLDPPAQLELPLLEVHERRPVEPVKMPVRLRGHLLVARGELLEACHLLDVGREPRRAGRRLSGRLADAVGSCFRHRIAALGEVEQHRDHARAELLRFAE